MLRIRSVYCLLFALLRTQTIEADCVTSEGTVGSCTASSECATSYHSVKPVLCRYSRGYGTRICCPRSTFSSHFSYTATNGRDDNDGEPLTFPSEPTDSEYHPYVRPTTVVSYNSNPLFENPWYTRPSNNRPQHHEKPSYGSDPYDSSYEYQGRPKPSYGFQGQTSPSHPGRPKPSNGFQGQTNPSRPGRPKPSNGFQGQTSPSHQGRPKPSSGFQGQSSPSDQERPKPSSGFQVQTSPSHQGRPKPSNGFPGLTSPSHQGRPKPSNGFQGQSSPSYQERPKPSHGFQGESRPTHSSHGNSDRNKPKPADWEVPDPETVWEYQPSRRTTTPRPTWAVENNSKETSSNSKKRISKLKCEEYSRPVSLTIDALPLSINAEIVPLTVQKCDFSAVKLVVGGEASELGEFPHMAAIGFRSPGFSTVIWNCGGTLISDRFVLTAGHCINTTYGNPVVVRLGEYNLARDNDGAEPEDYNVERIIVHPNYFKTLKYNDIALIKVNRAVRFSKWIRPACLPSDNSIREKPIATGWGRTDFAGKLSDVLMKVSLSIIDNQQCNSFYSTKNPGSSSFSSGIIDSMICAGELEGGRDTCLGDSGGPLAITKRENPCVYYVVGITSFGKICAAPNSPGVYTRVSKYLSWIEKTVWS